MFRNELAIDNAVFTTSATDMLVEGLAMVSWSPTYSEL